jgi:flagellar motor switch protein FliN
VSEEENLPSAEDMRARYAHLMNDDEPAQDESTVDSPPSTGPEPEPAAEPEAAPAGDEEATGHGPQATEPELEPEPEPAAPAAAVEPLPAIEPEPEPEAEEVSDPSDDLAAHLLDVKVRLWAELGRAKLPLAQAVSLGEGAIVDLDKEPEEPLDVLVNGLPFAKARLLLVDGEWAIRLEEIVASPTAVEQASSSGSGA